MSTQTIRISIPETGLSLTAQVETLGGTSFEADVAVNEVALGLYTLSLIDSSGSYRITLTDNDDAGALLGIVYARTANTTATFEAVSEAVLLTIAADAETAASNGGGGDTVNLVLPLRSITLDRVVANRIDLFVRESFVVTILIKDGSGEPVDCTGQSATLFMSGTEPITELTPATPDGGTVPNAYSFTVPQLSAGAIDYALRRDDSTARVLAFGNIVVKPLP